MIRLAPLLLLLATPLAAQEVVAIRSGEHATFTRLVFPAPDDLRWTREGPTGGPVTLVFDAPGLRFDASGVFARIPRTRIAALRAEDARLSLDLACRCDLSVTQIGSGHIVIDVTDAAEPAPPPAPEPPRANLPLQLAPVPTLPLGLDEARVEPEPEVAPSPVPVETPSPTETPPQIAIRPSGGPSLLPTPSQRIVAGSSCASEAEADALLRRDPKEALGSLSETRAGLVDEANRPSRDGYLALARTYLAAGFGAEATQLLRAAPGEPDATLLQIAAALDGLPGIVPTETSLDPDCGPASALLARLSGTPPRPGSDPSALRIYLDALPRARRTDLARRIRLPSEAPAPEPQSQVAAAGTDAEAVEAAIALLTAEDGPPPATRLGNALALRGSVPAGPLRDSLDRALALELAATGHLGEAAEIVRDRPDLAGPTLTTALDRLPPEDGLVAAVRLEPFLDVDDPARARAGRLLAEFGFTDLAQRFGRVPPPAETPFSDPQHAAWLARDLGALDPASARGRVAAHRRQRNAAPPAGTDFDRARAATARAGTLGALIPDLLAVNDPAGPAPEEDPT